MKNKIKIFAIIAVMMAFVLGMSVDVRAAQGKTMLSVSQESVEVGDTITVTAKAASDAEESLVHATMTLGYDTDIFELVSCSASYGGGNGSVIVSSDSFTVELKTISVGTGGLTLSAIDGMDLISGAEFSQMQESSTSILVNDTTAGSHGVLSSDCTLKSLELSNGTISPDFQKNILSYTAKVDYDVKKIAINAQPADSAKVTSVTGNTNLQVGVNTIQIEVTAENGTTAIYRIDVTRAKEEEQVTEIETETETEIAQTETETELTETESTESTETEKKDLESESSEEKQENEEKSFNISVVFLIIAAMVAIVVFFLFRR